MVNSNEDPMAGDRVQMYNTTTTSVVIFMFPSIYAIAMKVINIWD
jgi:hypothetical protein